MTRCETAAKFAREQLIIIDGSLEAAMARIGTERFLKLVDDIERALPKLPSKSSPKKTPKH